MSRHNESADTAELRRKLYLAEKRINSLLESVNVAVKNDASFKLEIKKLKLENERLLAQNNALNSELTKSNQINRLNFGTALKIHEDYIAYQKECAALRKQLNELLEPQKKQSATRSPSQQFFSLSQQQRPLSAQLDPSKDAVYNPWAPVTDVEV